MANKKKRTVNPKNKKAVEALKEEIRLEEEQKKQEEIEEKRHEKKKKKKLTAVEKNRIMMKIAGWVMAIVMFAGTFIAFLGYFIK